MNLDGWKKALKKMDAWIAETPARFYFVYVIVDAWAQSGRHWGKNYEHIVFVFKDGYLRQALSRKDSLAMGQYLYDLNAAKPGFVRELYCEWEKKAEAMLSAVQAVRAADLATLDDQAIWNHFQTVSNAHKEEWEIPLAYEGVQIYTEDVLIPEFRREYKLSASEASRAFSALSAPSTESFLFRENMALHKLALEAAQDEALKKAVLKGNHPGFARKLRAHADAFFYAKTTFRDLISYEFDDVKKAVADLVSEKSVDQLQEEIQRNESNVENIAESRKHWVEKLGLSETWRNRFEFTGFLGQWQDDRRKYSNMGNHALFALNDEIARRKKMDPLDVDRLLLPELKTLLFTGKTLSKHEFEKRRKWACVLIKDKKPVDVFFGDQAKALTKALEKQDGRADQIRGVTVSAGKEPVVRGRVRVVLDPKNERLQDGEVLVTSMTRPEFVPLMKKAVAVVTNEGGVTSHAAVVSRELNVSCIVGTRNATKILKTGDVVDVNTRHGTVLVVERAK